ncbi:hypothetical protein, partial [Oryzibacter oryziterrae]|uniref:hypothetical protein n=1 Tax=Oryzibacter oryziterrae TaxID=2766474 RepID=UPI001F231416
MRSNDRREHAAGHVSLSSHSLVKEPRAEALNTSPNQRGHRHIQSAKMPPGAPSPKRGDNRQTKLRSNYPTRDNPNRKITNRTSPKATRSPFHQNRKPTDQLIVNHRSTALRQRSVAAAPPSMNVLIEGTLRTVNEV